MSAEDDAALAKSLEAAAWEELDRQYLDGDGDPYVDALSGHIEGSPDMPKLILAILQAYWDEEGR